MVNSFVRKEEQKTWLEYEQSLQSEVKPRVRNAFWSYGEHELVGHGNVTNPATCGKHKHMEGCLNVKLHNQVRVFFPDSARDSVFVKPVYLSCDKPTCQVCYKYGWATREASRIERRVKEASKTFGVAEHIIVSVPPNDFVLSLEQLRAKCRKVLASRGVVGGVMIFHGFRYQTRDKWHRASVNLKAGSYWYWSPHFHVIGFVGGEGYGKCRTCASNPERVHNWDRCKSCQGFEGLTRVLWEKEGGRGGSGYVVKVQAARKTVGGTAWYQLNHCSIRRGSKKSSATCWFGVCSYRKMKLEKIKDIGVHRKCPICHSDLGRVRYLGDFSKLLLPRRGEILNMFDDEGEPLWEIVAERRFKDG